VTKTISDLAFSIKVVSILVWVRRRRLWERESALPDKWRDLLKHLSPKVRRSSCTSKYRYINWHRKKRLASHRLTPYSRVKYSYRTPCFIVPQLILWVKSNYFISRNFNKQYSIRIWNRFILLCLIWDWTLKFVWYLITQASLSLIVSDTRWSVSYYSAEQSELKNTWMLSQ
jgi:hypothetical protein